MSKVNLFNSFLILAFLLSFAAKAQISQGGIPESYHQKSLNEVTKHVASLPDWESFIKEESEEFNKPYLIGLFTETNINFPESGKFYTTEKNELIWKTAIHVKGAPALGMYFENLYLPKGVKLFVHNENKKHVLGAYTHENNNEIDSKFAIEAIQGETAYIELNITNSELIDEIQLNLDKALVYFRAYENTLNYASEEDMVLIGNPDPYQLEGSSSTCMINANCSPGTHYENQKRATVQLLFSYGQQGAGLCSGTIINSVGNTKETCRPLLMTASHCENSGTWTTNTQFSQLIVRFNFEKTNCNGGPAATQRTITGANYLTRSYYYQNMPTNQLNEDFLLVELRNKIPEVYNAYHAGVRLNYNLPSPSNSNEKFIGFHHPAGDIKKIIFANNLVTWGNQNPQNSVHWILNSNTNKTEGGAAQGSSGSGLFDPKGYYIGTASTAGSYGNIQGCNVDGKGHGGAQFFNLVNYSQVQKAMTYTHSNSSYISIKSFINPNNSNVNTIEGMDCYADTDGGGDEIDPPVAIEELNENFANSIKLYPNPTSVNGYFNIKTNFRFKQDLQIKIINVEGKVVKLLEASDVEDQTFRVDLDNLKPGMHLIQITNGIQKSTHKLMIN